VRNIEAKTLEEVVRCRDCRLGKPYGDKHQWRQCKMMNGLMENSEFCSIGERRELPLAPKEKP
jgi:hypothetical protein